MTEPEYGKYYPDYLVEPPTTGHYVPSFLTEGFNKVIEPLQRHTNDVLNGWELAVLAAVLLLVIANKRIYPRQFSQIFSVFRGTSQTNQLLREWTPIQSFINFSLQLSFILVLSLFVQKSIVVLTFSNQYNTFNAYLLILLAATTITILRYVVMFLVEKIFNQHDVFDRQTAIDLAVKTVALAAMTPLVLLLLYNPYSPFVMTGVAFMLLAMLLRSVYEFVETRVFSKISSFYIFLYLCALETTPILMVMVACYRLLKTGQVL